jgi:hypothetical protein
VKATFGGQAGPVDAQASSARQDLLGGLTRRACSPSTMAMATGAKDSEGMSLDRQGRLILSPNFLELGHEMIHALHNIRGANVKGLNVPNYQGSPWDNMSEHSVIEGTNEIQTLLGADYITENMLRDEHNLGVRFGHNTRAVLVNAIREKFLAIANKPGWDTEGGWIKKKTPAGIVSLRQLLAQQNVDWQAVKSLVQEKNQRNSVEAFLLAVPSALSGFYIRIEQFCDLYISHSQDVGLLRAFLDGIKNYNPI